MRDVELGRGALDLDELSVRDLLGDEARVVGRGDAALEAREDERRDADLRQDLGQVDRRDVVEERDQRARRGLPHLVVVPAHQLGVGLLAEAARAVAGGPGLDPLLEHDLRRVREVVGPSYKTAAIYP